MPVVKLFASLRKLAETKELSITEASLGDSLSGLFRQCPALDGVILGEGHVGVVFLKKTQQRSARHNQQDDDGIYPILEKKLR